MRILAVIGALSIIAAIAGAVYLFGGFYSVSAAEPQFAVIDWALMRIRIASVERYGTALPPMPLDDPALVRTGARAFAQRGCVGCHGAPGAEWAKFSEGLSPGPPDLKEIAPALSPAQVFWVVKNGVRMTGMPSFAAAKVGDREIWAIVAFVKKLPSVSPDDYKAWSQP